jgi:hypothetical protein
MFSMDMGTVSVAPKPPIARKPPLSNDLLSSGAICHSPQDVLSDHRMNAAQKRELLSSWASDACGGVAPLDTLPARNNRSDFAR